MVEQRTDNPSMKVQFFPELPGHCPCSLMEEQQTSNLSDGEFESPRGYQ